MELNLTLTRLFKYIGRTFLFVFDRFTMQRNLEHKTRQQIKKSIDCVFGIRTWGQGILGKDKSTELFNLRFVINKNILFNLQHLVFHVLAPLTSSVRIGASRPRPETLQMNDTYPDIRDDLEPESTARTHFKLGHFQLVKEEVLSFRMNFSLIKSTRYNEVYISECPMQSASK